MTFIATGSNTNSIGIGEFFPETTEPSAETVNKDNEKMMTLYLPTGYSIPIPPSWSIEMIWHGVFDQLFSQFHHQWQLQPLLPEYGHQVAYFMQYQDSAKVRFLCDECGHGWTSMKGRVVFWYLLVCRGPGVVQGLVLFKLFGQKCHKCNGDRFQFAMWYPEEVGKVVYNIFAKVSRTIYGFQCDIIKNRRKGLPRSEHRKESCEACQVGVCSAIGRPAIAADSRNKDANHQKTADTTDMHHSDETGYCSDNSN